MRSLTYFDARLGQHVEIDDDETIKEEDATMAPSFSDFLNDTHAAARWRMAKAAVPDRPREMTQTAVDERERLIGEYLHAHPAETRENAVAAVYAEYDGLYDRCRREETVDTHGGTLAEINARSHGTFGVDQDGRPVTKTALDVECEVTRRAAAVIAKCAHRVTVEEATGAVFRSDPDLYARWRAATRY